MGEAGKVLVRYEKSIKVSGVECNNENGLYECAVLLRDKLWVLDYFLCYEMIFFFFTF